MSFQPYFITYGERNVVIIVIVPTNGNKNELVTPTSEPPFAVTKAISPPDDDIQNPDLSAVCLPNPCAFAEIHTVKNLAKNDTATKAMAGNMNT